MKYIKFELELPEVSETTFHCILYLVVYLAEFICTCGEGGVRGTHNDM